MDPTSLIPLGFGLINSFWNSENQNASTDKQIFFQRQENQKNRDFSKMMYELQRDDYLKNYPELLKQQSDWQFSLWKNQFDAQNEYNNPQLQVLRSKAAGLQPGAQDGLVQGNNMAAQASMSPAPQLHGSPLGGSISPIGLPSVLGTGLFSEVGSFLRDLAQAKKTDKETSRYDEYMDSTMEMLRAETENKDEATRFQKILTGLKQVFGTAESMYTNAKLLSEAYQAQKRGDFEVANKKLAEADKNLSEAKTAQINELTPVMRGELQTQMDLNRANRRKAIAEADEALSRKELNKANKELADITVKVKRNESSPQILEQQAKTILARLQRDEAISQKDAEEAARRIEKLAGIRRTRENAGFVSRAVDDFFSWWTDHISTAVTGGVHASVSDNNSHSSVKYE